MPYGLIMQRAFDITRRQRALWPFGFAGLLVSAGTGLIWTLVLPEATGVQDSTMTSAWWRRVFSQPTPVPALVTLALVVTIGLSLLVGLLAYSVGEGALVHMVGEVTDGQPIGVREGLRAGWAHCPRLAGISAIAFGGPALLLCLALAPAFLGARDGGINIASAACCVLLPLLIFVVAVLVAVPLCLPFVQRRCILEEDGVIASIRQGIRLVRRNLGAVVVTGLLLLGLELAASTVLVPITIGANLVGAAVASGPVVATGLAYALSLSVSAFMMVFGSAMWTLIYRETKAQRSHPARGRRGRRARARG